MPFGNEPIIGQGRNLKENKKITDFDTNANAIKYD
jgi:hypothetical protein